MAQFDFDKAEPEEQDIMLLIRHNMVNVVLDEARKQVLNGLGIRDLGDYYLSNSLDIKLQAMADADVRAYVNFCKKTSKMELSSSLSDCIDFYKKEPNKIIDARNKNKETEQIKNRL